MLKGTIRLKRHRFDARERQPKYESKEGLRTLEGLSPLTLKYLHKCSSYVKGNNSSPLGGIGSMPERGR